jgi:hypothetical protein
MVMMIMIKEKVIFGGMDNDVGCVFDKELIWGDLKMSGQGLKMCGRDCPVSKLVGQLQKWLDQPLS